MIIYFPGGGVPPTYQRLSYLLGVQVCPKIAFFAIFRGAAWAGAGAKKGGGASGGPLLGGGGTPPFHYQRWSVRLDKAYGCRKGP